MKSKKTILIVAAMEDVELDYLESRLENLIKTKHNGFVFYEGNIGEKKIVLCVSNIGLINASAGVAIGIEKYNPDLIINEGVAGSLLKNIHKGDIIIGTEAINITSMEYIGPGNTMEDYEITTFLHGEDSRLITQKANQELLEKIRENLKDEKLHFGIIASGDIWNKDPNRIEYLCNRYQTICEDMESVAIYTIANMMEIPVVAIKGISDNEILGEEYELSVSTKVQQVVEKIIKEL